MYSLIDVLAVIYSLYINTSYDIKDWNKSRCALNGHLFSTQATCDSPLEGHNRRLLCFNKTISGRCPQVKPTECSPRKEKVGKQSDGKSQARETKRVDPFILLCEPCPPPPEPPSPFSFSLSHTHLKTPGCYCGHRHQDAIDRQDILFTTQSSRGWVWGLGSCRRQRSTPGQLQ